MSDKLISAYRWSAHLLDALVQSGVTCAAISPGSRSTPLTMAAADHPLLKTTILLDERSAGFFALGAGKRTGKPAILICTSGTAVANYMPAVLEARTSGVPIVILSADRPPRLRGTGASQTIDQIKLFGDAAVYFHEAGEPQGSISDIRRLRLAGYQAVRYAIHRGGAAHINLPFRKPLEPNTGEREAFREEISTRIVHQHVHQNVLGQGQTESKKESDRTAEPPEFEVPSSVRSLIGKARRPLFITGPCHPHTSFPEAAVIAAHLGAPLLTEPGDHQHGAHQHGAHQHGPNQYGSHQYGAHRHGPNQYGSYQPEDAFLDGGALQPDKDRAIATEASPMICCADAILSSKASRKRFKPDLIVHFSHNPVSSTLLKALDEWVDVPMIRFVREGDGQPETTGTATLNTSEEMSETELLFSFHPVVVVPQGAKMVFSSQNRDAMAEVRAADAQWLATWQKAEIQVRKVVSAELEQSQKLTDPHVFYHLSQKIRGFGVMVSNSFPVRDMALFGMYNAGETINRQNTDEHHTLQVPFCGQYVNRGAAGIDGILSTAAGLAFASSGTAGSAGNAGSTGNAGSAGNAGTSGSAGSAGSVGNAIASTYRNAWACFMGDLAFLHDSNALMVLNQLQLPLIVFVINNGGGTIFRMLPVAGHTDIYKDFFETPQQVSIRHLALAHNLAYDRIESLHELLRWTPPPAPDAPLIVELCTDADESMKIRTAIKHAMSDAMNDATHDAMSEPTDDAAKSTNGKEG